MTVEQMDKFSDSLRQLLINAIQKNKIDLKIKEVIDKLQVNFVEVNGEFRYLIMNQAISDAISTDIRKEIEALWLEGQ